MIYPLYIFTSTVSSSTNLYFATWLLITLSCSCLIIFESLFWRFLSCMNECVCQLFGCLYIFLSVHVLITYKPVACLPCMLLVWCEWSALDRHALNIALVYSHQLWQYLGPALTSGGLETWPCQSHSYVTPSVSTCSYQSCLSPCQLAGHGTHLSVWHHLSVCVHIYHHVTRHYFVALVSVFFPFIYPPSFLGCFASASQLDSTHVCFQCCFSHQCLVYTLFYSLVSISFIYLTCVCDLHTMLLCQTY